MAGEIKKSFVCGLFIAALFLLMVFLTGCGEPAKEKAPDFLIKTALISITPSDFSEELDMKKAAYPYNIHENPEEYNEMVIDLVKNLSEEIVLLSASADKGVIVTDQELETAEKKFKKDYPEDSFEQILLENAISYSFWKKRFKKNMIMDKFIDQELKKKIVITSQDIVDFYKEHRIADVKKLYKKIESEKELVVRLREQKTQDHYNEWIQALAKEYPVEINRKELKNILMDIKKEKGTKE